MDDGKGIRITVREKGKEQNVKMLRVTSRMTLEELASKASSALQISPKSVLFFKDGPALEDIRLLRDNDVLVAVVPGGGAHRKSGSTVMDVYQIAVMGPGGVGKSALTIRFCQNEFVEDYDPTIEDAYRHHFVVDSMPVTLDIMDTAGQEEYEALRQNWMQENQAFVLVFDLTRPSSLSEVKQKFYRKLKEVREDELPPIVLVGNKMDLKDDRNVTLNVALKEATEMECSGYLEASAKTGEGVAGAFEKLVQELRRRTKSRSPASARNKPQETKPFFAFCSLL